MFAAALAWCLRNPLASLLLAAVLALGVHDAIQSSRLALAHAQATAAKEELKAEKSANEALGTQLAHQNAMVDLWKAASDKAEARLKAAAKGNADKEKALQLALDALKNKPVPKDCQGALNWLVKELQ